MMDYSKASTNRAASTKMIHSFLPWGNNGVLFAGHQIGGSWRVVQIFAHRHLWNVDETSSDETPKGVALSYQDDECVASNIQHTEVNLNNVTTGVENEVITDASVVEDLFLWNIVEDLHRQREVEVEQNYSEKEEDETGWKYASDDDERTIRNDDDSNND
jgi:hypothetical protein